ncbi:hypothetical protein Glo7428_3200 [Gloeocapsa sp. PCC 7428]|uniref:hypothetical protein n=1 Tax=Gloeocapsa sp. PCC 7428 TaxID=1173026 RepID=UPI0002A5C2A6|nr:hypothetical protein [Gloeocapsa sp. PCC 7428]AFZ31686.1 hypothetical protein Glo7428_3200 [Gloeocapsa sp. PCC 7428]
MPLTHLVFLAIGLGLVWVSIKFKDDVYRLATAISGAILIVWGFALTPLQFQLPIEALVLILVFPICLRCLRE